MKDKTNSTVVVYTYRYIWKEKDGKLCVKYLTEPISGHEKFIEALKQSDNVVSAAREYVNQIDYAYIGWSDTFKTEEKKDNSEETK